MGEYKIEIKKINQDIDSNKETDICIEAEEIEEVKELYDYVINNQIGV